MTQTAGLFPGHGSQRAGMREIAEEHAPELLEATIAAVGEDPFARVEESTRFAQPAIYCASIAGWQAGPPSVAAYAGHSLGEIAALVAAGALTTADGLRVAVARGELMAAAAARAEPGGMLAVLGADPLTAEGLARRHGLYVANDNAPTEQVLSGTDERIEAAVADARDREVLVRRLKVNVAFHTPAMESARDGLRDVLAAVEVRPPVAPVISCLTAEPFRDVRAELADACVRPVRWRSAVLALRAGGIACFVQAPPGTVLAKMLRRALADVEATSLDAPSLRAAR